MRMFQTESTLINSYGYDPATKVLRIEFQKGGTWEYADVPQDKFEDFLRADSKGKHFLANIKGTYTATKL